MARWKMKSILALTLTLVLAVWTFGPSPADAVKRGGMLKFVVGSKIPSYDGHRETTFGVIHPIRPFYSLLIRVNPNNPQSPTDFVCDLCAGSVPKPTEGGTKYTFKINKKVWFHNGAKLTAADIKATFDKIIFPPKGIPSARKAFYVMVKSVSAPDKYTIVFTLKYASGAFVPALANPFNWIYSKADLDKHGMKWHRTHINGSGAFRFVQHKPGAYVEGKRYKKYHHKGKPYLDGYRAISAPKMSIRLQAIRGGRAFIEFRGFPPKARDDLKKALGKKLRVQESDWNCNLMITPNNKRAPFDNPNVRRALTLAVDRWAGSKHLSRIAIVRGVGGIVFPKHPFAATKAELQKIAGYWPSIKKSRAEARRLLKEAGVNLNKTYIFNNRGVDQPYKIVGTWLLGQWRSIGLKFKQEVKPSPAFYDSLRKKHDWDVSIDFNCQSVINPLVDISKFLSDDVSGNQYAQYIDRKLDKLFDKMNKEADPKKQRVLIRQYEKHALDTAAHQFVTLWWYKINPHHDFVKGWKIAPSHYLNQSLDQIWLDR
ncbi:MAG TPA: ABC transporter substrate-binding protein [Nitrospinae bacterium]|nr:ABC transporter substrate-binding protein [Nitrospinota bacterium]